MDTRTPSMYPLRSRTFFLDQAGDASGNGGGGSATQDPPAQRSSGPGLPTGRMTANDLSAFIRREVDAAVGSSLEERQAAERETRAAERQDILTSLQGMPLRRQLSSEEARREKGLFAARCVLAIAGAAFMHKQGAVISPAEWAKRRYGQNSPEEKALSATVGTEGGFLIPEEVSGEIIELIRPVSVVRSLNPTTVPLDGGNLTMPRIVGGASATYIGENQNIPPSQPVFGQVRLVARKLAALVPISNDLLRRARGNAEAMVRDDIVNALAQRSDQAFLRGNGTEFSPRGLRYWALPAKELTATAGEALADVVSDLARVMLAMRNPLPGASAAQVRMIRPGWIMSPRTEIFLQTLRDAQGQFAFRQEMVGQPGNLMTGGTLWGYPYRVTTQIPDNLGAGTNETEIYFADFADVLLGETTGVLIDTSTEAAYWDGATVQAAFSLDQTLIRAIVEHDLSVRNEEAVAVLKGVVWTP